MLSIHDPDKENRPRLEPMEGKRPLPKANPRDYKMAYGKHSGKSLGDIVNLRGGLRYLMWLMRETSPTPPTRAAISNLLAEMTQSGVTTTR